MVFVLPTLSRPQQCQAVLARIRILGCASKGIVFVNGESHAEEYRQTLVLPYGWEVFYSPTNLGALGALNKVFEMFPDEKWYGFLADDEFLDSESQRDWDQRLIAAAGDWKIAHGWEDWNLGRRCQGFPVWGGKLLRAVGYWALPTCFHSFGLDSHWEWLSGANVFGGGGLHNMVCLPEIKVYHNRAKPDLVIDECYKIVDETMETDRNHFWDWCKNDLRPTAERVRKAIECSQS